MGQNYKAKPSGVHWSYGQTKGQLLNPGRSGLGKSNIEVWDPLGWPQTISKDGWVAGGLNAQGKGLPCSCVQGAKRSLIKIYKNVTNMGMTSLADILNTQQVSNPKS